MLVRQLIKLKLVILGSYANGEIFYKKVLSEPLTSLLRQCLLQLSSLGGSMLRLLLSIVLVSFNAHGYGTQPSIDKSQPQSCELAGSKEIDMECIGAQLQGEGLGGWVHASVDDQMMFVFTWRRPGNFFVNVQIPMSSKDPAIIQRLLELRRHDRILIKGSYYKNEAPIKHINVSELKVVEAYDGVQEDYQYDQALPNKILSGTSVIGKVHIVANGGSVLVVEVGDRVYPVFNKKPELVKDLYRNDKIEIQYYVSFFPTRPPHLELNVAAKEPVRVIEEIAVGHNQQITLKGPLVMFPKSPQIIFNVYALRTADADGVQRNYTLVNFSDFDLFKALREKLEEAWNKMSASAKYDRNKYINYNIMIEATGTKNVVDPVQANPQILINDLKDLKIMIK